jgi:hypothetical protein
LFIYSWINTDTVLQHEAADRDPGKEVDNSFREVTVRPCRTLSILINFGFYTEQDGSLQRVLSKGKT